MDLFFKILSGVAIAALSSGITVYLSLNKFRTEKWWEKKAAAYSNLLGALYEAKTFADAHITASAKDKELTDEEDQEVRTKTKRAEEEIYRAMAVDAFYLSPLAIKRLETYGKEASRAGQDGSWSGYLFDHLSAADTCLRDMMKIARADLKIESPPRFEKPVTAIREYIRAITKRDRN
jgi:hypothetical protein